MAQDRFADLPAPVSPYPLTTDLLVLSPVSESDPTYAYSWANTVSFIQSLASGTWSINILGNSATATNATFATTAGGAPPTGLAGGSLVGSYPNPTLTAINSDIGSFGTNGAVAQVTLNSEGRVTSASNVPIIPAAIGAPTVGGSGASGIWTISITGNAQTATSAPPSGSAGGALTGLYPNPTLATAYLPLAGGTLTGNLILNGDATLPLQAVTYEQLGSSTVNIVLVTGTSITMTDTSITNRYILQNSATCTLTLPATITAGHTFEIVGGGTAGWIIAQNAGQNIQLGNQLTTLGVAGSLQSTFFSDSLILSCSTTNNVLTGYGVQGNISIF